MRGDELRLNNLAGDVTAFIMASLKVLYGNFVPMRYFLPKFSTEMIGFIQLVLLVSLVQLVSFYTVIAGAKRDCLPRSE